jgi:hypothetical protein
MVQYKIDVPVTQEHATQVKAQHYYSGEKSLGVNFKRKSDGELLREADNGGLSHDTKSALSTFGCFLNYKCQESTAKNVKRL